MLIELIRSSVLYIIQCLRQRLDTLEFTECQSKILKLTLVVSFSTTQTSNKDTKHLCGTSFVDCLRAQDILSANSGFAIRRLASRNLPAQIRAILRRYEDEFQDVS